MTLRVSLAWRIAPAVLAPLNQIVFFTFLGTFATALDTASFYAIGNATQLTAMSGIQHVGGLLAHQVTQASRSIGELMPMAS
ncbi:MAG: hypothetical protein WCD51_11815 [Anaerolineae bacterium]|jgi:hypothetical protein